VQQTASETHTAPEVHIAAGSIGKLLDELSLSGVTDSGGGEHDLGEVAAMKRAALNLTER
jgi:hypothetical protein